MGNGALPNGSSYRAHPRLYLPSAQGLGAAEFNRCASDRLACGPDGHGLDAGAHGHRSRQGTCDHLCQSAGEPGTTGLIDMADSGSKPVQGTIGLALSGGGSRAVAFHLGCLRALTDLQVLEKVKILSTVSGGSVIGGLYAMNEATFPEFEKQVRDMLARGLLRPTIRMAFFSPEGLKALLCAILTGSINLIMLLVSWAVWAFSFMLPPERRRKFQ